jgi:3alpha(or 20beta)-hydroxysteroid dehydrogenase
MARLTGKVALITGAAGGQGTAEAELFAREGAALVVTDVDEPTGQTLARRLAGEGGKAVFLQQDVADEASWKETLSAALTHFGKLHILVNNAGTIARQGIVDTTLEAWNRTLAVNLTGAMLGMKHCAPAMRDSGGGSILPKPAMDQLVQQGKVVPDSIVRFASAAVGVTCVQVLPSPTSVHPMH